MANLVDLSNDALAAIGAAGSTNVPFISSLDDARNEAVVCKRFLASTDKSASIITALLEQHDWNFARRMVSIAAQVTAPILRFTYSYVLPADYIKVRRINGSDYVEYKVEGNAILTSEASPIILEYTAFEMDANRWSSSFYQCASLALQAKCAYPLKSDSKLAQELTDRLFGNPGRGVPSFLLDSASMDGIEGSQDVQSTPDLILVRG